MRQYIGVPIPPRHYYWRTDRFTSNMVGQNKRNKKKRRTKQFGAPHLFSSQSPIKSALHRKRKYIEEKTTATLKIKQTSIATVRNHILTVVVDCFLTPLPLHYPLPLNHRVGGGGEGGEKDRPMSDSNKRNTIIFLKCTP